MAPFSLTLSDPKLYFNRWHSRAVSLRQLSFLLAQRMKRLFYAPRVVWWQVGTAHDIPELSWKCHWWKRRRRRRTWSRSGYICSVQVSETRRRTQSRRSQLAPSTHHTTYAIHHRYHRRQQQQRHLFTCTRKYKEGDHLPRKSGKPGNVREFDSCQGNVKEKNLVSKSGLKLLL